MRRHRKHEPSQLEIRAKGNPAAARAQLSGAANALDECGDDLKGFKQPLVEALLRISKGERPERILGLIKPAHRPRNNLVTERNREIALQYWEMIQRGFKQDTTAERVGKLWRLSSRHVRRIAEPLNEWAIKQIGMRVGALNNRTPEEIRFRRKLLRFFTANKDRK